jgi:hypothetical protein
MPKKGKSPVTTKQRAKIAAGRVKGKTHKTIAKEMGLAESTVRKQAVDVRTRAMIAGLKQRDQVELEEVWAGILGSIQAGLKKRSVAQNIAARRDGMKLLVLGDTRNMDVGGADDGEGYPLEDLLRTYREAATEK